MKMSRHEKAIRQRLEALEKAIEVAGQAYRDAAGEVDSLNARRKLLEEILATAESSPADV